MKQGSGFSHIVICHLKTNLGCMNPLLYYGIREEDVLTSLHQRAFLWESIIQRRLLSPEWSECTWVEFSFVNDSLDVSALKCGVELVFQHNLEEFTLSQCITSYKDPSTSNERLPFTGHDKMDLEKKLFFDIACFFKGEDQNWVADILESIHYSDNDLRKLIDKSLFTIGGGKLCTHHLIQQMGWKIVYGESTGLGRRSRLWLSDDVFDVLKKNSVSLLLY